MEIWTRAEGATAVVRAIGEIDVRTAPSLRHALDRAVLEGSGDVVLDLSGVGFVDSSGLGVILGRYRRMPEGRSLILRAPRAHVRGLLEISGVTRLLTVEDGPEEAHDAHDSVR